MAYIVPARQYEVQRFCFGEWKTFTVAADMQTCKRIAAACSFTGLPTRIRYAESN